MSMNPAVLADSIVLTAAAAGMYLVFSRGKIPWRFVQYQNIRSILKEWSDRIKYSKPVLRMQNEKKDKEIYEAIAFLRNMTAIGKGSVVSSDFIIQQLAGHKGILQSVYVKMLSYLRLNKKEDAAAAFYSAVGTPISKDFARLLIQWDEIDPKDLTEILLSHQKNIKEVRFTNQKKRDELISDLIYFPVVVNVILIFMNFIYVAYFIDQKKMLDMFF